MLASSEQEVAEVLAPSEGEQVIVGLSEKASPVPCAEAIAATAAAEPMDGHRKLDEIGRDGSMAESAERQP